jgi:hypothetical protein
VSGRRLCWGVYREIAHSPGRETDDALILRATAAELEARGFEVALKSPDELPETTDASGVAPFLFVMCERIPTVERLAAWERQGVGVVNRPEGIRNTDRERTIARFASRNVAFPASVLVRTDAPRAEGPGFPCWVKRGDVHATQEGDVSYAADPAELSASLSRLASAVLQRHVPGDLIKFYGVAGDGEGEPLSWFQWFYHRDQKLSHHAFDPTDLRGLVGRGAAALGLEVFGGDAIVGPDGAIVLIDVNAWPSFALFRPVASVAIGRCLAARFQKEAGVPR